MSCGGWRGGRRGWLGSTSHRGQRRGWASDEDRPAMTVGYAEDSGRRRASRNRHCRGAAHTTTWSRWDTASRGGSRHRRHGIGVTPRAAVGGIGDLGQGLVRRQRRATREDSGRQARSAKGGGPPATRAATVRLGQHQVRSFLASCPFRLFFILFMRPLPNNNIIYSKNTFHQIGKMSSTSAEYFFA